MQRKTAKEKRQDKAAIFQAMDLGIVDHDDEECLKPGLLWLAHQLICTYISRSSATQV